MTYERIKIVKGHGYRYLVRGVRENGKVKQRVLKYLGAVSPANKTRKKKSTGRKPYSFVRQLKTEEKKELENITKSNNAFARDRAKIILLSAENIKTSTICSRMHREKRSVLKAISEFNKKGLACLQKGKTLGPKAKFTKETKADIIGVVNTGAYQS